LIGECVCFCCVRFCFWATVCKTFRPMLSDHCPVCPVLSCLSVTLVYCGQTAGRIKIKLGMEVGLGPGHIVSDRDPPPPQKEGHSPTFRPCLFWQKGWMWMDQDAIWYGGRPWPKPHCVRWGPSSLPFPAQKGTVSQF